MQTIGPNDGGRADFPVLGNRYILRGQDTGGGFALIEHEIAPRSLAAPAGFERYFEELAPHLAGDGPPDLEALAEIQGRYGLSMDMESRERLTKEHGLLG